MTHQFIEIPRKERAVGDFHCDAEALARVRTVFQNNFSRGLECGAALSIWRGEKEVLNLSAGLTDPESRVPWTPSTPVLVWSATKGPSSACVLDALGRAGISLDRRVSDLWPSFAGGGKSEITFSQVLSHSAGLVALDDRSIAATDHEAIVEALAGQAPAWPPGTAHGYAPRLFGPLLDEICRRASGIPLGEYWKTRFADPYDLEFWIGMPEDFQGTVARVLAPKTTAPTGEKTAFERSFAEAGSLTRSAFSSPAGNFSATAMNAPAMRQASFPALGGIGTARALAKFYSLLAEHPSDLLEGNPRLSGRVRDGHDLVLQLETAFSAGFMLDPTHKGEKIRTTFGPSMTAFGHPGAGGSLAFADPENHISFAYVMNQMEPGALPRERTRRLVRALYGY